MIDKKFSYFSILIGLVVIGILAAQLPALKFDYELENFFPIDDPDLAYYREYSEVFGHDNDYLLLGFDAPNGVFQSDLLGEIEKGLRKVSSMEETNRVISPTSYKTLIKTPLGKIPIPLVHLKDSAKLKSDSAKLYQHPFHRNMFISRSGNTLKAIVVHQRFIDKESADRYVTQLMNIFKPFPTRVRIAGKANAQTAFVNAVRDDFGQFLVMAIIIIFLLLMVFFRNLLLVIISLFVAVLSVVGTIGIMAMTGKSIDVLSSLIPTILLVVAMSDLIHLFSHIQKAYRHVGNLKSAINIAVRHVGLATLLTSFTTAVGFLTLITINVLPVVDLGLYAALGILFAFLITYLIFPSTIYLINPTLSLGKSSVLLSAILKGIFSAIVKRPKIILLSTMIFIIVGLVGLTKLEINAFLVNDLPDDNQVKADFVFFDQEFAGSKPFSLSVWLKDSSKQIYSQEIIKAIDRIEQAVGTHVKVGDLISPVTIVKFANQSTHQGSSAAYRLPKSDKDWRLAFKWIDQTHPEYRMNKVSENLQARISGFYQDLGSKDAAHKQNELLNVLDQSIDQNLIGYKLTGTSVLVDKSHEMLSVNLIKGLLMAIGIVALIVGLMFRSWRMIFITLIPNLLPLLLVAALMGYSNIPISLSTSVIFAISFGIVVDDTIHFLSRFKAETHQGKSSVYAIKAALFSSGEAILTTTIILTCGFLIFCFSNFSTSFYMGLFVSLSFVAAVVADLLLLPLLIILWLPSHGAGKKTV